MMVKRLHVIIIIKKIIKINQSSFMFMVVAFKMKEHPFINT